MSQNDPGVVAEQLDGSDSVRFDTIGNETIQVSDRIERRQYHFTAVPTVSLTTADITRFQFPVDNAVATQIRSINLSTVVSICVRDDTGQMVAQTGHFASEELPADTYSIELCTPIKLYLRVTAPVTISSTCAETTVSFGSATPVVIGARSKHERPAATITTTSDPHDLMAVMSTFGSALKTTSPERSYPTLRGHPPTIKRGDELLIPSGLQPPNTGITIEIPPDFKYLYPIAPLVYYLGATVRPADTPRIVTETGFEYELGDGLAFEQTIEELLKQTFLLDCVTRTEGLYPVTLHERSAIESVVNLDFQTLYDESIASRLEQYLSIPYTVVEPYVPAWKLTTHIDPVPDSMEMLPFLVNDLAILRTPTTTTPVSSKPTDSEIVADFLRDKPLDAGEFTRHSGSSSASHLSNSFVQPETTDSLEQAWIGEETPIGASKPTLAAYQNRLDRAVMDGDISITVVCNDPQMVQEHAIVDAVYGSRADLPFEISLYQNLTCDGLRDVLVEDSDFLHYIGHIETDGFRCTDGLFDVRSLSTTGIDSFFLNACQSYDQGMALLDAGAIAGIATLTDVINSGAVQIGSTIAKLLNSGFPFRPALDIARIDSVSGTDYIVIGDGGLTIAQPVSGIPIIFNIIETESCLDVSFESYTTHTEGMGTLMSPGIKNNKKHYLSSTTGCKYQLDTPTIDSLLSTNEIPILFNHQLYWSNDINSIQDLTVQK
ncbi:hypothetical protein [Natronocalculus amylovorans]|uniref:CHAT domain-containing protein n=1 Tax=Natronocalculus amylovorans TaxID=2917812 RepID=A0AAE3FVH8_9EURY|nr:hypothetical protein [Natronocalculus amylovorans]MCL9815720.1 hypothetical protein [Natronocalculus amylovorans]